MKFGNRIFDKPNVAYAVIPRPPLRQPQPDGTTLEINQDIVFVAEAVLDHTEFDKLCSQPQPQPAQRPGGETFLNVKDPKYIARLNEWANHKRCWLVIESLKATKDLIWETVDPSIPSTWVNYETELKNAKFTQREINEIFGAVIEANALNDDRIREARERFLSNLPGSQSGSPSPKVGLSVSKNGEPVSV